MFHNKYPFFSKFLHSRIILVNLCHIPIIMAHNYEDIVRNWYVRLRPEFLRRLTLRYSGLTLADAENLYQDAFMAVYENIHNGSVKDDTSWSNYILRIGMNLASKEWRKAGRTDSMDTEASGEAEDKNLSWAKKIEDKLKDMPDEKDIVALSKDTEAVALLGEVLNYTPEPCKSIIYLFYEESKSMTEIAAMVGLKNSQTAKAKKSQCMKDYIRRGKSIFSRAGYLK